MTRLLGFDVGYNLYVNIPTPICFVLHTHMRMHACTSVCIIITTTQKRQATQFLEKYTSHFIERVVCERELENEQNCNILTSTLMAISVSFPFSWAAQPEARGPSSMLGAVFSTASFLQLSDLQNWLNFLCTELYNNSTPTQYLPITGHRNMHFRRLWNGMFGRVGGQYTTFGWSHNTNMHQDQRIVRHCNRLTAQYLSHVLVSFTSRRTVCYIDIMENEGQHFFIRIYLSHFILKRD